MKPMKIQLGTTDRISGIALLILALVVAWESRAFPLGTLQRPGPAFMLLLLAAFLGGIAILIIVLGAKSALLRSLPWTETKHVTAILAACGFAALALERLGYRITMTVVLVILLGVIERNRLIVVLAGAFGFSLGSYWIFTRLGVLLPRGLLNF